MSVEPGAAPHDASSVETAVRDRSPTSAALPSASSGPLALAPQLPQADKLLNELLSAMACLDDTDFEDGDGGETLRALDRATVAAVGRHTSGISPTALFLAWMDWYLHLSVAPGKRIELGIKAWRKLMRFSAYLASGTLNRELPTCIAPLAGDDRFRAPEWQQWPYRLWYQSFLLNQQWWHNATHGVPGVSPHHEGIVSFFSRQMLDMLSPSNNPFTNPEVLRRARETKGANFAQGLQNALEDMRRKAAGQPPVGAEKFVPGHNVAVTEGEVVFRNHLIELIQYRPTTETVAAEPVLIVPAWIMKYYILDLSPHNSLIRYLVGQGHTVFCISWRNVGKEDRDLGLDDYRQKGVMAALDVVNAIVPGVKVHTAGYCLGGTILAITAAAMARARDERLASVTLFAAQTDFSEPGELQLFVDSSTLYLLESTMWEQGYLGAGQMAGAFQMLRSNDLVWSRMVREYLLGERGSLNDLMAWNADATRMPYRMHSEYLRRLFLNNDLAAGRYEVEGRPASLQNVRVPMFVVGTERDHVAPWKSVYKIHQLTDTDITFVLASGGHNAGIVSEPGRPRRHHRIHTVHHGELHLGPEEWVEATPVSEGSWWPAWSAWLFEHSPAQRVAPPAMGTAEYQPLCPAPGTYIMQR